MHLLFRVINVAFPEVTQNFGYYYGYSNPISFPIATLIVAFPLFLLLSWFLHKTYAVDPSLRDATLRKWLVYITLFVAGVVLAGDLVTLLYRFLDGQELTTAFLLKVLAVLVVAGSVFGYFLSDLRGRLTDQNRTYWRIFSTVLVLGAIVLGFAVVGSPRTQRLLRYDAQRVQDMQNIQWQLVSHWQTKRALPATLAELTADKISGWQNPTDPETGEPYEYERTTNLSFRLCSEFDKPTPKYQGRYDGPIRPLPTMSVAVEPVMLKDADNWYHDAGRTCFERTIDPDLYPPFVR